MRRAGRSAIAGRIASRGELRFEVRDTQKPIAGLIVHEGLVQEGAIEVGDVVQSEVDHARRTATRRNHSATHLLHWALRTVLGEQATQKGSLVGPDRLRFDFSFGKAVTPEELAEDRGPRERQGRSPTAPVLTEVLPIDEAGARAARWRSSRRSTATSCASSR